MGAKKLVIHHGGSWAANCYEGGMTKWVHVLIGLTYDDLVKLVQDVAKVEVHRSTLELCSLAFTTTGTARLRIDNDKDVSCMMDEDKLLPEVYVTVSKKVATHCVQNGTILEEDDNLVHSTFLQQCNLFTPQPLYDGFLRQLAACGSISMLDPIVCNDETIDDEENRMIARYPTLTKVVTEMKIAIIVWVLVLGVLEDMDVLVYRVLLHLVVIPFERMDWVTVFIKVVNMLPHKVELFLDPKGIRSNSLARRNRFQMMAGYTREQFEVRIRRSSKTRYEAGCKDGECEFQLRAFKMQKGEYWVVRMFLKDHTCNIDGFHARLRQANSWTVGELLAPKLQFEYLFIAHAVTLHGFRTVIRPVIAIDGTHLKCKFYGIMFVAICLDANNQVFPLAYGFGDVEDEMSWTWFLNELKNAIGSPKDCMIISDRHLGIKATMEKVYPIVPHGYCVFHMAQNIKNDYKRKDVSLLFKQAWKAYRKADFKEVMLEMMKVNRVAFEDLINVGPERWSRAYSPVRRYRLMTSSIAESMNSCLVHARQMPITTMVEFIREMLQKWFYKRRTKVEKTRTQLTPWATELIKEKNKDLEKYTVHPIDSVNFNVKDGNQDGLVNLSEKTCSCTKFQVDKLPCRHALAAIRYANKPFPDFYGDCYKTTSWLESYSGNIFPVGHPSEWNIPQDVRSKVVHLPPFRAQAGRPKKKRFKSAGEHGNGKTRIVRFVKNLVTTDRIAPQPCPSATSATSSTLKRLRRPYRCRKCGEEGHNSQKCPLTSEVGGTT
ncbi:hypothetical protein Dsin_032307 [Dipteronia sinensis]|uniref:SWIM-type domain-containing protein n=1 Tax=Dipteronia sinensis TaxID=43782 RepID=A0AAD9ZMZ1_9ROSI|nr:hypothetical protein Dsin_032307 [Dipteronia sinensis]